MQQCNCNTSRVWLGWAWEQFLCTHHGTNGAVKALTVALFPNAVFLLLSEVNLASAVLYSSLENYDLSRCLYCFIALLRAGLGLE